MHLEWIKQANDTKRNKTKQNKPKSVNVSGGREREIEKEKIEDSNQILKAGKLIRSDITTYYEFYFWLWAVCHLLIFFSLYLLESDRVPFFSFSHSFFLNNFSFLCTIHFYFSIIRNNFVFFFELQWATPSFIEFWIEMKYEERGTIWNRLGTVWLYCQILNNLFILHFSLGIQIVFLCDQMQTELLNILEVLTIFPNYACSTRIFTREITAFCIFIPVCHVCQSANRPFLDKKDFQKPNTHKIGYLIARKRNMRVKKKWK